MEKILETVKGWLEILGPAAPWILALLIIIIGSLVAKIIAGGIRRALKRTKLDDKLAGVLGVGQGGKKGNSVERTISTFIYWVLMLFIVIFALNAAGQQQVAASLQGIFDQIVGFLPRVFAAAVIGFVAWLVATIAKNVVSGLLGATRIDERLGLNEGRPITNTIALVVFFGIILMLLPVALGALQMEEISRPISDMVSQIFAYIPNLFSGVIIIAVGYLIATIVQKVLTGVLSSIGADTLPTRLGFSGEILGGRSLSAIVGYLAMATILVIMSAQAIQSMNLGFISDLATQFVPGYFKILMAVLIFAVAFFVANIVSGLIANPFWARIARIAIIIFFIGVALQKADISHLSNSVFQLVITCLIVAAAFAAGVGGAIAIGLGGRDKAASILNRFQ